MQSIKNLTRWSGLLIAALALAVTTISARAEEDRLQDIVDAAVVTLIGLTSSSNTSSFHKHISNARGILIVPLVKSGGAGGVMLARVPGTRKWSYPAFCSISSESSDLQAGIDRAEVVLLIMTEKGMKAMLGKKFQPGLDVSVAAGSEAAANADILQIPISNAVSGGVSLEGASIAGRDEWNRVYYGKAVRQVDILISHQVQSAGADRLRKLLASTVR